MFRYEWKSIMRTEAKYFSAYNNGITIFYEASKWDKFLASFLFFLVPPSPINMNELGAVPSDFSNFWLISQHHGM